MTLRDFMRPADATALPETADSAPARPRSRTWRAPLAAKLTAALVGLVVLVLLVNGAVNTWLNYDRARHAALEVQEEKARSAAERVSQFLTEIETQLGWTIGAEWRRTQPDQQRYDFIRLLRQAPAITELSFIDGQGKEQLKVSRLEPDSVGSGKDFSKDPRFVEAVANKTWFGPVEFRRGSEPYMTIAVAHVGREPGVTVADVNLKLVWDVITAIHVGEKGYAYVVDDKGRLIAHPDLSLVLRDTDMSQLPQVRQALQNKAPNEQRAPMMVATRVGMAEIATSLDGASVLTAYAVAPRTNWIVFVQSPVAEALAPVYRSLLQTVALLGLGLLLALIVGSFLARRMVVPIRRLQQGAERLGAGDLSQRLDVHTGDEIQTLADRFNQMAGRIQESYETLEAKVEARTKDLNETLQQQTATADVLKVISRSAFDLQPVLDTLVESAFKLCGAGLGLIYLRSGDVFECRAIAGAGVAEASALFKGRPIRAGRGTAAERVIMTGEVHCVEDFFADPDFDPKVKEVISAAAYGFGIGALRSTLAVPMKRDDAVVGVIAIARAQTGPFPLRQIELLETFADQAVIAIENVRLFEQVRAKTRDLEESLAQQTATADVLKVISRSAFSLSAVFQTLIDSAVRLCGTNGVIYLRRGDVFEAAAAYGDDDGRMARRPPRLIDRSSMTGRVALSGSVEQIPDNLADPDFKVPADQRLPGIRAMLGVPLLRNGRVEGVFVLGRPEPGLFTERQIEVVKTFADQAVIAVENVRLFDEVQAKTSDLEEALQQQTATADVLKVISRSVADAAPVFETILESCERLFEPYGVAIYLVEGDVARGVARRGFEGGDWGRDATPLAGSSTGMAIAERRAVHLPDLADKSDLPEDKRAFVRRNGGLSVLYAPMLSGDRGVGSIVVARQPKKPFSDAEIEFIQTFADQAVIAIENARLFEEVQAKTRDLEESLAQQTATADVLKVISRSAFDLEAVFNTLLSSAVTLSGASSGVLCIRDGEVFRAKSFINKSPDLVRLLAQNPVPPGPDAVMGRVALSGRVEAIEDTFSDSLLMIRSLIRQTDDDRALVGVPLLREGRIEGGIILGRREPGPFAARAIELVQTFADQAVIAIENVRLFEEVQAKTRDLEESLAQQTATADVLKVISRSAFDLQAVFDTLISTAVDLNNAYSGAICVRDGDVFRYRASRAHHGEDEVYRYLVDHPATPDRSTVVGRAILSGQVEQIPDLLEDKEYTVPMATLGNPARALLGVPLLGKERVEGAIVLSRREPGLYPERQIETLKTFADQAVIAIENARLFDQVQARTKELAQTVDDLRSAQDRLIQSEKLASLGQLTAGIAHEIKNPLNFVNNFAALSRELIEELKEIVATTKPDEKTKEEIDEITGMLEGNLAKVVQHGKRADSIVKNMLLHSRESSGEHRPVDLNATVEEAVNLAYHGARAEKPGFNITLVNEFDPSVGEVDLYPQEFTRVLLNLISNGFYAAMRRKAEGGDAAFEPMLKASTKNLDDKVEIKIRDNGTGIPPEIKAKMFNPFFTTKPAGEGTGLGLSLSYDIVVKQHGGTIDVDTKPGEFTEFTLVIPRGGAPSNLKAS